MYMNLLSIVLSLQIPDRNRTHEILGQQSPLYYIIKSYQNRILLRSYDQLAATPLEASRGT